MKKNIYKFLTASLILATASSCNESGWDSNVEASGMGTLELSSLAIEVNNAENVVTRTSVNVNDFIVTIVDNSTNTRVKSGIYSNLPEVITLPASDNYKVIVESHEVQDAEWEKPYYKGSKEFSIANGKITKIGEVTAKFASLKVTIKFDGDLKEAMDANATVTVYGSNGSQLVYTPTETRAGYFAINGSTTFAAHFNGIIGGVSTTSETAFQNVAAGQHHILTYTVKGGPEIPEQSGGINTPEGTLDVKYEVNEVNSNTNVEEDLLDNSDRPGKEGSIDSEDPNNPDNPDDPSEDNKPVKFSAKNSPNLNIYAVNKATEDFGNAIINIEASAGIKTFLVEISSTDTEGFLAAIQDIKLESFDLTQPGELEEQLKEFGLPCGDQVKNQTSVDFNITSFIPLLLIYKDNGYNVNTFKMSVTDNNGETGILDLQFSVE